MWWFSGFRKPNRWRWGHEGVPPYSLLLDRPPRGMPKAFWGQLASIVIVIRVIFVAELVLALTVLGAALVSWGAFESIFEKCELTFCALVVLFCLVSIHGTRRTTAIFSKYLVDSDFLVCDQCGYCLKGSVASSLCPECGTEFEAAALRDRWKRWKSRVMVYD
jgi:hypothetical protein